MCGGGGTVTKYEETPKEDDAAVQEAIAKERELALKRKGRKSTILTSSAGLADDTSAKKTTLGG